MNMTFQKINQPFFCVIKGRCYDFFAGKCLYSLLSVFMTLLAQNLIAQ